MQLSAAPTRRDRDQITRVTIDQGVHFVRIAIPDLRTHDINRLRTELSALYEPGAPLRIALSLKRVNILSSACMGMFVEFSNALAPVGGSLVLYEVPRDIAKVLKKLKLHKNLPISKNANTARRLLCAQQTDSRVPSHESAA
ncbi:MAG: hypothetical protein JKY96_08795 [Phycisphaerales bacterium]|nr:hypothetical protein [Phycisphaerales bacterium]